MKAARPSHAASHGHAPAGVGAAVGALGIVFGDLGTSPLYAVKESLGGENGAAISYGNVLGVMSLVFWSLVLVVIVKYLLLVMRADNRGEGGILALSAVLMPPADARKRARLPFLILLALFGCGLMFGDGIITPVISVLSAIEGLEVVAPGIHDWIVPITIGILVGLFAVQRHGTGRIGAVFGPIMLLWFVAIGVAGLPAIVDHPEVLRAIDPRYAVWFFVDGGPKVFWVLGSVVLCVTGAEALYADMGHFGRRPIRQAWAWIVFPGVLLSYFGQGARLLESPVKLPFFELVPSFLVVPMVILAAAATAIASQALISGVFSLIHQAVQLGYLPRLRIVHTSADAEGQIYVPVVNAILAVACVIVAIGFRTSTALAAAFGIAVSTTMAITTILLFQVARTRWKWRTVTAALVIAPLILVDLVYTAANAHKLLDGGWLPLAIGVAMFILLSTWWRGTHVLQAATASAAPPMDAFLEELGKSGVVRPRGTGVFMTSSSDAVPLSLVHLVENVRALPKQVVLLSILTEARPWMPGNDVLEVTPHDEGFVRVVARLGFMQSADVPKLLERCRGMGLDWDEAETTYYLGRNLLVPGKRRTMAGWRKRLFMIMARNAGAPTQFYGLPPDRTVELGAQYEL